MSEGEERAKLKTRAADRLNAVVWRLPVPRRVQVILSQLVYTNPPISRSRALAALQALERAEVRMVAIGGWGVDALVGRQLRPHADLDLLVGTGQLHTAVEVLEELGFDRWHSNDDPGAIGKLHVSTTEALRDGALRVVELHEADLGDLQTVAGSIAGQPIPCLPAEHQLQAQREMGRTWTRQRRLRQARNVAAVERALRRGCESA
jgi:lincosamide nucleotidyltransferase A/C/D/E